MVEQTAATSSHLPIWGGIECSVTRIGEHFHDQTERSRHSSRDDDLSKIARLGIRTLRYPFVWERAQPTLEAPLQWDWTDRRYEQLLSRGIDPIAGLLHHGSGPRGTSLLDRDFPDRFADYAEKVSRRYPSIRLWTPINEPLTTARFSCLYGHWYPHVQEDRLFCEAVLLQTRATQLAMQAIRSNVPEAKLVQTEDLGFTMSTDLLRYQAAFDNTRRWLSLDLLVGNQEKLRRMLRHFAHVGVDPALVDGVLNETSGRPDILGFNHYVTSVRYIDHRVQLYPENLCGGNGLHRYADVEAVRVAQVTPVSLGELLEQAWRRYEIPMAMTEVHLTCSPEQQMRWFYDVYQTCSRIRDSGIPIQAVTVWALLGLFDWDTLTVDWKGNYETGAFDISSGTAVATEYAELVRALCRSGSCEAASSLPTGWWTSQEACLWPPANLPDPSDEELPRIEAVAG